MTTILKINEEGKKTNYTFKDKLNLSCIHSDKHYLGKVDNQIKLFKLDKQNYNLYNHKTNYNDLIVNHINSFINVIEEYEDYILNENPKYCSTAKKCCRISLSQSYECTSKPDKDMFCKHEEDCGAGNAVEQKCGVWGSRWPCYQCTKKCPVPIFPWKDCDNNTDENKCNVCMNKQNSIGESFDPKMPDKINYHWIGTQRIKTESGIFVKRKIDKCIRDGGCIYDPTGGLCVKKGDKLPVFDSQTQCDTHCPFYWSDGTEQSGGEEEIPGRCSERKVEDGDITIYYYTCNS